MRNGTYNKELLIFWISFFFCWNLHAGNRSILHNDVNAIANQLYQKIQAKDGVLVSEFQDLDGRTTYFGRYLSDEVHVALANMSGITVLHRQTIQALLKDKHLPETGVLDEMTAIKIGKMMGAKTVVYGTVTDLQSSVGVNLKIIDTEKGFLIGGVSHDVRKSERIAYLIENLTREEAAKNEGVIQSNKEIENRYQAAILDRIRLKNEQDKKTTQAR